MKTLHLNLKRKWFDMILSGEKKEEYREIKRFWFERFKNQQCRCFFRLILSTAYIQYEKDKQSFNTFKELFESMELRYKTITFSNGYAKNRDQFVIELKGIRVRSGLIVWGAEDCKKYFVLQLGDIINENL